jgi:pimeloyl-ACP methyl ester carboxylesterase
VKPFFVSSLLLGWLLASCAPGVKSPVVAVPDPLALERVNAERWEIPGFPEPHTPEALNKAYFVRYSLPHDGKARAVVVLMPGFLGGVANFDRVARGVVSRDSSLEVWAVDRRSNGLEDHRVLDEAYRTRNATGAWQYHIRDLEKPGGFKPLGAGDVKFMGYWGLQTHLEDLRRVIQLAHGYGGRVILGGHSLGAALVSLYAGWDFAGTPGYQDVDGLILLDGVAGSTSGGSTVSEAQYLNGQPGPFGILSPGKRALESGEVTPYFDALGFGPAGLSKLSAAALLAAVNPNGDSPGGLVAFPASNLAAGMVTGDDDYAPIGIFSVSAGRAVNAQVAINGLAVLLAGLPGLRTLEVTGVAPGSRRVEWQTPASDDPKEVTDPLDFAQRFYSDRGDFQEWYFPQRLTLDMNAVGLEAPGWATDLPLRHVAQTKLPMLAVRAGRGIVTNRDAFKPLETKLGREIEKRDLPGYTHLDVLAARANPLPEWIVQFAQRQ